MLGEFEYFVLSAAIRLGSEAYGASILQQIETTIDRSCSIGALYTTLIRLEEKGLVKTFSGDPTPERGGRARKMVRPTVRGIRETEAFYAAVNKAARGLAWSVKAGCA